MPLKYKTKNYDMLGVAAALLCLLHCLVFPLLIFIPIGISHNPYVDLLFLLVGVWSVYKTAKNSKSRLLKFLLFAGILLISISVGMDIFLHLHSPLMYIGAAALIAGHLLRMKAHYKPKSVTAAQALQEEAC